MATHRSRCHNISATKRVKCSQIRICNSYKPPRPIKRPKCFHKSALKAKYNKFSSRLTSSSSSSITYFSKSSLPRKCKKRSKPTRCPIPKKTRGTQTKSSQIKQFKQKLLNNNWICKVSSIFGTARSWWIPLSSCLYRNRYKLRWCITGNRYSNSSKFYQFKAHRGGKFSRIKLESIDSCRLIRTRSAAR